MGCISSKILTKSLSFREDLSRRSKRNRISNGIPTPDELFTSGNGTTSGDHKFLGKSQTGSFNSAPKSDFEPTNVEMINTWELMAGLEEQVEQKQEAETKGPTNLPAQELVSSKIAGVDKIRRSKSRHWSLENEGYIIDHPFEGLNVDQFDGGNKGVGRSGSFHTVEEYEAMLERIQLSKGQNDDFVQLKPCGASAKNYQHTEEHNRIDVENPAQLFSRDIHSVEDNNAMTIASGPDIKEMLPSNYNTVEELSSFKDVGGIQGRSTCDTGLKRKAMARGLESLQIPSAVELRSIGSLREWLHVGGGCVESPGHYATPKFGNYNKFRSEFGEERKEESIFDPELLTAFEEFIRRVEIEEERILTKIEGNPDKITANDISAEENKEDLLDDRSSPQFIF